MKLSIITINYNDSKGLRKTSESIVNQMFTDFEWIIIDGGSNDGSVEIIREYVAKVEQRGVNCYWISEPDEGIYNAMNKGIKAAKGEYIQFLNCGDWLLNEHTLENVFKEKHNEDILFGTEYSIDPYVGTYEYGFKTSDFSAFDLLSKPLPHQATFAKRELFDNVGLFDESFSIVADLDFSYRAIVLHNASVCYLPQIIVYFDGNGISNVKPELLKQETERIVRTYLPPRFYSDFVKYNDVVLNYGIIEQCKKEVADNHDAIRLYNALMRKKLGRVAVSVMFKIMKINKKIE